MLDVNQPVLVNPLLSLSRRLTCSPANILAIFSLSPAACHENKRNPGNMETRPVTASGNQRQGERERPERRQRMSLSQEPRRILDESSLPSHWLMQTTSTLSLTRHISNLSFFTPFTSARAKSFESVAGVARWREKSTVMPSNSLQSERVSDESEKRKQQPMSL